MSIQEKRDQIVEELMPFEDHFERFAYIIDRAKGHPPLADEYKICLLYTSDAADE